MTDYERTMLSDVGITWLSGVSITCFASCYAITLLLEVSRLFLRAPIRLAVMLGFTLVGMVTHTIYLVLVTESELKHAATTAPLSNWHDWCLMAAWVLTAAYIGLLARHRGRPEARPYEQRRLLHPQGQGP